MPFEPGFVTDHGDTPDSTGHAATGPGSEADRALNRICSHDGVPS